MITRLEIDGFKTFRNFSLDFAPLQVIVGANAVGKSNLFDALRLLSRLADNDLRTAFQGNEKEIASDLVRGEAIELFTALSDGSHVTQMRFGVEMLVERHVQDSWGAEAELKHTRMRYELGVERRPDERGLERLYVTDESLKPIYRDKDPWVKHYIGHKRELWLPVLRAGRKEPFISTTLKDGSATISLHQDGHGGRKSSVAARVERTVLSGVANTEFPHVFAAREEMRAWRFLQLDPWSLRQPSQRTAPQFVSPDGSNLASTLARLNAENQFLINDISRDLASLVPGIVSVEVDEDRELNRYIVQAQMQDGRRFSSRVLSDGTLRLLVLVTLKNDPEYRGVLSFEEPENGVHPFRLRNMMKVLQDLTTDFETSEAGEPLRQLLLNTHSPVLVNHLVQGYKRKDMVFPGLYYAYTVPRAVPGNAAQSMRITRVVPVTPSPQLRMGTGSDESEEIYSLGQVIHYLESVDAGEAVAYLQQHA